MFYNLLLFCNETCHHSLALHVDTVRCKLLHLYWWLKLTCCLQVTKKLGGADAGTAQCMTSVGNELGQVLVSVLTEAEGSGLQDMSTGLQERYRRAGKDSPQVLYVERDCCSVDGGTSAAALFPLWPQMSIRLDIRCFLVRLAAGVKSKSHALYPDFLQRLSGCVFEWDQEDLSRLRMIRQSEQSKSRRSTIIKEMSRHCRRRTRGAQETERLIDDLLQTFMDATDIMGFPLLDWDHMKEVWSSERKHVACIQVRLLFFWQFYLCKEQKSNPPLAITKLTLSLSLHPGSTWCPALHKSQSGDQGWGFHPCLPLCPRVHIAALVPLVPQQVHPRWVRTNLRSWGCLFPLVFQILTFLFSVTGTNISGCYFQMYLLEGLTRWNEDRAQGSVGGTGTRHYNIQLQNAFNQLSQHFYGVRLAEGVTPPEYTGKKNQVTRICKKPECATGTKIPGPQHRQGPHKAWN